MSFRKGVSHEGTVTGISHANSEVRISTSEGHDGIWHKLGCVYPAPSEEPSSEPPHVFTFADFRQLCKERQDGTLSFAQYKVTFEQLVASKDALIRELTSSRSASELKTLARSMGVLDARGNTKPQNAQLIHRRMLSSFLLDAAVTFGVGESYEDAIVAKVRGVSESDWNAHHADVAAKNVEREQALAGPRSLYDFSRFIEAKGADALTNEQMARWDALHADLARERRAENGPSQIVSHFQSDELANYQFTVKEGYHEKRDCKLWIVQLSSRVDRAAFMELKSKAKMLGGWYSSFKRADAGFQFLSQDTATRFTELLSGDVDRADVLAERGKRKQQTAAERLHELGDDLTARADETIERSNDSLQNTQRRASIQAGVRGRGYADWALARSLHSLAEALSTGQAVFLDGIRHKTHLVALDTVLYLAKLSRIRAIRKSAGEGEYGYGLRIQDEEERPYSEDDVRFAEYPYPSLYRRHLEDAVAFGVNKTGMKQSSAKMAKTLNRMQGEYVSFTSDSNIQQLADFLGRAKSVGFDSEWLEKNLEGYQRLQRAHIGDIHELRAALREYLPHKASVRGDDPAAITERQLIGKDLPGFFPTPRPVIDQMLELARIEPHHSVLEPSCGKGDIVEAIARLVPEARVTAIEQNLSLADVLAAKGITAEFRDFLEHTGSYDRIVMNPPFERGAEIAHVRHAFDSLTPGGRLVSVMSEGPFFRSDKTSAAFRQWFDEMAGDCYELPPGSFSGAATFRQTDVTTRLVVIDRE